MPLFPSPVKSLWQRVGRCVPLCLLFPVLLLAGERRPVDIQVRQASPDELLLHFRYARPTIRKLDFDGQAYHKVILAGLAATLLPGAPELPIDGQLLAVPPGLTPHLEIVDHRSEVIEGLHLPPVPEVDATVSASGKVRTQIRHSEGAVYNSDDFFPAALAHIDEIRTISGYRIARIAVHPFRYRPVSKTLEVISELSLRIRFEADPSPSAPRPGLESGIAEHFLESTVLNPDALQRPAFSASEIKMLSDWYDPRRPHLKIKVAEDGLYRLTYSELVAAGFPVDRDPRTLRLYVRGREIPIRVAGEDDGRLDPGDTIELYGEWNRGGTEFYDAYTDTAVYWLTSADRPGRRTPIHDPLGGDPPVLTGFTVFRHLEEDHQYHQGDNSRQLYETDTVEGETWVWKFLNPGESVEIRFQVPRLLAIADPTSARLRARMRGTTTQPGFGLDHKARVLLNGLPLGEFEFDDFDEAVVSADFPAARLQTGENVLQIVSEPTTAEINQFYVDWAEIEYPAPLEAVGDSLTITLPQEWSDSAVLLDVSGFSSPNIRVFDISDTSWVGGIQVISGSEGYTARAKVPFRPGGRLVLMTDERFKSPAAVQLDKASDWRGSTHGADLLIITHRDFTPAAERLAEHRRVHNGLRVVVADVEDVYDEFNYGLPHPDAIKAFVEDAVSRWDRPAPRFLLLFGDTTWDVKMRWKWSRKRDYVLSYGNPVSDNWFVSLDGPDDFLPDLAVGRIPAETLEQAQAVVDKIETYDATPTAWWQKRFLFVNGGINDWEQNVFRTATERVIEDFVVPVPSAGLPIRFYRTSTEKVIDVSMRKEIIDAIDQGNVWMNVMGHAALTLFDVDFGRPSDLNNAPAFPFITSMSCRTGLFSDPQLTSIGESYLIEPERGAIAFWGTSGWGFVSQDNILIHELFRGVAVDTIRALGEATTFAKLQLWRLYGGGSFNRHVINQYSLLGDPSQPLALRTRPDLTLRPSDVVFAEELPSEADSLLGVTVRLRNYGLATTDSIEVEIVDEGPKGQRILAEGLALAPLGLVDSVRLQMPLEGQAGLHRIRVRADPRDRILEADEWNNEADRPVTIYVSRLSIARPLDGLVLSETPELVVYNAFRQPDEILRYEFELDTLTTFDSPFLLRSGSIQSGEMATRWRPPDLPPDRVYYWRSRTHDGKEYGVWATASFRLEPGSDAIAWDQADSSQFTRDSFTSTGVTGTGVSLEAIPVVMRAESAGADDGNSARLFVDGELLNRGGRGHNMAVVSPGTGEVLELGRFDTYAETRWADSLTAFVARVAEGDYVLAAIQDEGSANMTEAAYQALESLGSRLARDVGFRDSWAFIGFKGTRPEEVKEALSRRFAGPVAVADTFTYYPATGTVMSPVLGPASRWGDLDWEEHLPTPGTRLTVSVLGLDRATASWDTLSAGLQTPPFDLSGLDPQNFPRLRLLASLTADKGQATPVLRRWRVAFEPGPDLALGPRIEAADTLSEGGQTTVRVRVVNLGYAEAQNIPLLFAYLHPDSGQVVFAEARIPTLGSDEEAELAAIFNPGDLAGTIPLLVVVDPADSLAELSEMNNSSSRSVFVAADTVRPVLELTVDGKTVSQGDFVSPDPEIVVRIEDNTPLSLGDTTRIDVVLDGQRVPFFGSEGSLQLMPGDSGSGVRERARVIWRPQLEQGEHHLVVVARDRRGNLASEELEFVVASTFEIREVLNYPNPFSTSTTFTYRLSQPADQVSIRIYTISGKLIQRIDAAPSSADFNMVEWDGLDRDGDRLANGVYLYKVTARRGEEVSEVLGRLAVIR